MSSRGFGSFPLDADVKSVSAGEDIIEMIKEESGIKGRGFSIVGFTAVLDKPAVIVTDSGSVKTFPNGDDHIVSVDNVRIKELSFDKDVVIKAFSYYIA